MTSREMLLDFIETFGIIAISTLIFYFVVVENYFGLAEKMVKFAMTLAVFSLPLIISARINKRKIKFYNHRNTLDKVVAYGSPADITIDRFILSLIVFFVLIIPLYYGAFAPEDLVQALIAFVLLFAWHLYFFKKHLGFGETIMITRKTFLLDKIFIKVLPVLMLLIVLVNGGFDEIDIMQAALIFVILHIWRWYFYKQSKV